MKLQELFEAKVGAKRTGMAMNKMVSYIERKLGEKLLKIPGVEHYNNSNDHGYGHRYVFDGSTRCIRFNWSSDGATGHTGEMQSIDLFTGASHDPNFHIHTKGISLVKSLPMVVSILKSPSLGKQKMFPIEATEALSESVIAEAKRTDFTADSALSDFLKQLTHGKTFTRSDFIGTYHIIHAGIFDTIYNDFKDKFSIDQRRVGLSPGSKIDALKDSILSKAGVVEVTKGGSDETFLKTKQEETLESEERVPYADVLEHLEGLVTGVIKGAFNSLFVAGKGGVGKTNVVEKVLAKHGLTDGNGYFLNTGTASAAGVYALLYHNRNNIILFDDCDGALNDTDARNIIKAATDTKKIRKLVWNKKSSFIFDPDEEDADAHEEDPNMAPKFFDFKGRIIFISNLPLNKLDPDGSLRTRAFVINVDPSDEELLDHMGKILHDIRLEDGMNLTKAEREEVLAVVKGAKKKSGLSLRKLVRALNIAASGTANWARLVELYS